MYIVFKFFYYDDIFLIIIWHYRFFIKKFTNYW